MDNDKERDENSEWREKRDPLTQQVIGCAIEIHRNLGPGLLESTYQQCLAYELALANVNYKIQARIPLEYKNIKLDCGYRVDFIIEDSLIVELKAVDCLLGIHEAQLITYMKLANVSSGLLINFNVKLLKNGLRRLFQSPSALSPCSL